MNQNENDMKKIIFNDLIKPSQETLKNNFNTTLKFISDQSREIQKLFQGLENKIDEEINELDETYKIQNLTQILIDEYFEKNELISKNLLKFKNEFAIKIDDIVSSDLYKNLKYEIENWKSTKKSDVKIKFFLIILIKKIIF